MSFFVFVEIMPRVLAVRSVSVSFMQQMLFPGFIVRNTNRSSVSVFYMTFSMN